MERHLLAVMATSQLLWEMIEMGTTITIEQNSEAAKAAAADIAARFGDAGVTVETVAHKAGKKFEYVRIACTPEQWRAVAKHMKNEVGVNHCAMVTGTHYPCLLYTSDAADE